MTVAEATAMSETLRVNYGLEGAEFVASLLDRTADAPLVLTGHVNWTDHTGFVTISGAAGADAHVSHMWWRADGVIVEDRDDLGDAAQFAARFADPSTSRIDFLADVVTTLASETPDNPQLLRQRAGAGFVRTDEMPDGTAVSVLRSSASVTWWIDMATNRVLRLDRVDTDGVAVTIVFGAAGYLDLQMPDPGQPPTDQSPADQSTPDASTSDTTLVS